MLTYGISRNGGIDEPFAVKEQRLREWTHGHSGEEGSGRTERAALTCAHSVTCELDGC